MLLDMRMGDITGPELYAQLVERWGSEPIVILVTAEQDDSVRAIARQHDWGFLPTPVRPAALRALIMPRLLREQAERAPGA